MCTQPTTEQFALAIWARLSGRVPGGELSRVRVYEHDDLFAVVAG